MPEEAVIYGLGEQTSLNLRPGSITSGIPIPPGVMAQVMNPFTSISRCITASSRLVATWSSMRTAHEACAEFDSSARVDFTDGALRMYLFAGDLAQALVEYTRLTGRLGLPPLWALGFHQCRWGYRTADEVRKVLQGFKQHRLPLDAFHFDIDYMDGYRVFSVDEDRFAGFDTLLDEMNQDGVHPVVIIDPGVKIDPEYGVYKEGIEGDHFRQAARWQAIPRSGLARMGAFSRFHRPETRRWWGSYYKRFMEDGIAGFWHDMNEPTSFSAWGSNQFPRSTGV